VKTPTGKEKKLNHQRLWKNYFRTPATFEKKNENHCKPIAGFIY
jgi:hypothetical protein